MNMRLKSLICALAVLAAAPAAADPPAIDYGAINAHVLETHLRPRYQAVTAAAAKLVPAVDALCKAPDAGHLQTARTAFHAVSDAWQAIEHIRTGPAAGMTAHARINFWPDERDRVGKHLRSLLSSDDAGRLDAAGFAQGSVAVQGLPALERLLFADKALEDLKAAGAPVTPCKVARTIAVNIDGLARDLEKAWAGISFKGGEAKKDTADLFTNLAGGLGAIADMKIGAPLGEKTGRTWPKKVEQWRSTRGLRNLEVNVAALRDLYLAMADGAGGRLKGTDDDKLIRQQFAQVLSDLKNLPPSLQGALDDDKGRLWLQVVSGGLRDLRDLTIGSMTGPLNLILGFNSFDGD